jgi:hypothetical protein
MRFIYLSKAEFNMRTIRQTIKTKSEGAGASVIIIDSFTFSSQIGIYVGYYALVKDNANACVATDMRSEK